MARIGIVTIWFDRGQAEVSRTLRQALVDLGHEVHVFARMGYVYGKAKQEVAGRWQVDNLHLYPEYRIHPPALKVWAYARGLHAVIFNEEYDWNLPYAMQSFNIKTIHYIDFLDPEWRSLLDTSYDQLWSATRRTSFMLEEMGMGHKLRHIGWGIHPETPYLGDSEPQYDFFHNAGWLGINFRKGTDLVLEAFSQLVSSEQKPTLLVHAQVPHEDVGNIPHGVTWRHETVPPPGLYHLGKVVVQPSRLEGLGLTIPEAMWQGRQVITTDAPPMSEFVGLPHSLVPVASTNQREDGLAFPECVADVGALADRMQRAIAGQQWREDGQLMRDNARIIFDWTRFCDRLASGLKAIDIEA